MISVVPRSPWLRRLAGLGARLPRTFPSLLSLGIVAQLVVLLPSAGTPYWGDDNSNAYIAGYLHWIGERWWPFIWAANKAQWTGPGRPMPLGVLQTYGVFYLMHDRVAYKLLLIALTLIASAMVALLVRRLGASPPIAALAAALPAVAWQLHLLHDPLLSYAGLMQAVTIYASGAMLVFLAWLRQGGAWRLGVVMLLTACACVTYESSYLLAIGLVLIAWRERRCSLRQAVFLAWPGLVVAVAFIVVVAIRAQSIPSTSGYHLSTNPVVILRAWAKIVASGLPIIGRTSAPGPGTLPATAFGPAVLRGVVVTALLFPLLLATARPDPKRSLQDRRTVLTLVGVALALMLTPALLTALSPQYEHQVQWGWGYLPMFFAVLGWGALGAIGLGALLARLAPRPAVTLVVTTTVAVLAGVSVALNAEANARVIDYMKPAQRSRSLLEASFQRGLLDSVPRFGTVLWYWPEVVVPRGTWVPGAMNIEAWTREFVDRPLTMHLIAGSRPGAEVCADASLTPSRCRLLGTPTFWLRTHLVGTSGFVAIDQVGVRSWGATSDTITAPSRPRSRPVVFVENPLIELSRPLPFEVTMARGTRSAGRIVVPSDRLHILREGSGWVLAQLPPQPRFSAFSIEVIPRSA